MNLCECGCGQECKNRFVRGHNKSNLGKHHCHTEATKQKLKEFWKKKRIIREIINQAIKEIYEVIKYCECGCGQETTFYQGKYSRFIKGHHKIRRRWTEKSKQKISNSMKGQNNPMFGTISPMRNKHHTKESKKKISENNKGKHDGKKNKMYGHLSPKDTGTGKRYFSIKEEYLRSSWELIITDWFFNNYVEYLYEPKRFYFKGENFTYLPDFYIPKENLYIEVKGRMDERSEKQIKAFIKAGYKLLVIDGTMINNLDEILDFLLKGKK